MNFEFATATKIIFGKNSALQAEEIAAKYGRRLLLFLGPQKIGETLFHGNQNRDKFQQVIVTGEPSLSVIEEQTLYARENGIDIVVSIGGGSVIDTGKAVSGLVSNDGEISDYLEVVGKNLPLKQKGLPFIAIPTTAGTGAEVTRNAVISVPDKRVKVSLRSPYLYPTLAIVDPVLTTSMPPDVTASTGLDALTQVLEPFVSIKSNWMTDMFCREGIMRIGINLEKCYLNGGNELAREGMSWGSLMGGLALANSGLGVVHGFAGPIGGMFDVPHGKICAAILPAATRMNIKALLERAPEHPALGRYLEAGRLFSGVETGNIFTIVKRLQEIATKLNIHSLKEFGISPDHFDMIIEKTKVASSTRVNPIMLGTSELRQILDEAL